MNWKDQLRPASFRGIPFFVEGNSTTGGRRIARHDFPNRDVPFYEDLGLRAREFQIQAYLLGSSYIQDRDALLAACEKEGPGPLIHPNYGTLTVRAISFFSRETKRAGGRADILIIFSLEEKRTSPSSDRDPLDEAIDAASDSAAAAETQLEESLQVAGHPEFVREATAGELGTTGGRLLDLNVFSRKAQEVAAFATKARRLIDDAASLATSPVDLVVAVRDAVAGIRNSAENALEALYAYEVLFGVEPTVQGGSSPAQRAADGNTQAVSDLVRQLALTEAAQAAGEIEWESYDQAVWGRDLLLGELDSLSETAQDPVFQALGRLRSALVGALPPEESDLPRLETLVLSATDGALQLAYRLYDDVTRGDEIAGRNAIRHPAFLPGGEPLQVLIHG